MTNFAVRQCGIVDNKSMDKIDEALQSIDRSLFLPEAAKGEAAWDVPVAIGFGQTNSQPTTVRLMLEWLDVEPGNKVLDVGSGSGWTTALLAHLVGPKGKVYAVERIPELLEFGEHNVGHAGVTNARFFKAGKTIGLPRYAPYDRILVSASAKELLDELTSQLKPGGKMVIPVGTSIFEIEKLADGQLEIYPHAGFVFVPLIP
jgi:protein-L-isoaspartate(D-aspartate) O-methyltransferase